MTLTFTLHTLDDAEYEVLCIPGGCAAVPGNVATSEHGHRQTSLSSLQYDLLSDPLSLRVAV